MKYFLDFDGVIFNTEALKQKMAALGIEETERSKALFDAIHAHEPSFDVATLMFADAQTFLNVHAEDCEIVSSYVSTSTSHNGDIQTQREYQTTKIALSGATAIVGPHAVHVVGRSKSEMLSGLKFKYENRGMDCVFVDDRLEYIKEAESLDIPAFWMDRRTHEAMQENEQVIQNRITSFGELEKIVAVWK